MTTIYIPCADGTDPCCKGDFKFDMPDDLSAEQLQEIIDAKGYTTILLSDTQVKSMGLSPREVEACDDQSGDYLWEVDLETTCGPCGSDY